MKEATPTILNLPSSEISVGTNIGLLGGSFNPAHEGHLEISLLALEKLRLDYIWWMVSPQNPLKPKKGMASLSERLSTARRTADDPRISVTDVETELGTLYTVDTLLALRNHFSETRFVWLMGADNLLEMHRWQKWSKIFYTVPVAVFARPNYSLPAEKAEATKHFAKFRMPVLKAHHLAGKRPPAWVFFKRPSNPISATKIRSYDKDNQAKKIFKRS